MLTITRIYTDDNGDSLFEEVRLPLQNKGVIGFLSESIPVQSLIFREVEPGYDYDFHTAPQRQYIVLLDGGVEIETSLGDIRSFPAGSVILAEDTTGKGHKTKNLEQRKRQSLFILL